jgi:hypothetical protein
MKGVNVPMVMRDKHRTKIPNQAAVDSPGYEPPTDFEVPSDWVGQTFKGAVGKAVVDDVMKAVAVGEMMPRVDMHHLGSEYSFVPTKPVDTRVDRGIVQKGRNDGLPLKVRVRPAIEPGDFEVSIEPHKPRVQQLSYLKGTIGNTTEGWWRPPLRQGISRKSHVATQ